MDIFGLKVPEDIFSHLIDRTESHSDTLFTVKKNAIGIIDLLQTNSDYTP